MLIGCAFVVLGASRWLTFAVFGGETTTHDYEATANMVFTSSVMLFKVYLAMMVGVALARWQPKHQCLLVAPTLLEVVVTTPLAVYAAYKINSHIPIEAWNDIALWTLMVRCSLPVFVGLGIYLFPHNGGDNEGSDRRGVSPP